MPSPTTAAALVLGDIDLVRAAHRGGLRVLVASSRDHTTQWSRLPERHVLLPDGWSDPDAVVDLIEAMAHDESEPPVLIHGHDEDVLLLARQHDRLSKSVRFVAPEPKLALDLVDKSRFIALAATHGLPVPVSMFAVCAAIEVPTAADIRFPLVAKPATRDPAHWLPVAGRAKALRFDTPLDLAARWEDLRAVGAEVILQEFLPGPESDILSYHAYVDADQRVAGEFSGRKIRTWPQEYGHSTSVEITADVEVMRLGRDLLARLEFTGVAKLDFKPRADGTLCLLEVNPRFSLWHHPAAMAGVNIPALVHADLTGMPRPETNLVPGVRWCHPINDLFAARAHEVPVSRFLAELRSADARHGLGADDPLAGVGMVTRSAEALGRLVRQRARSRQEDAS